MSRIELEDSQLDVMMKMSEGNPGALTAMMDIIKEHESIDPQAVMGGLGAILILDNWGIYGSSIYVLWNDKCNRDVRTMLMLIRATQLGFFSQSRLQQLAADQMRDIAMPDEEIEELDRKVCEALDQFKKKSAS